MPVTDYAAIRKRLLRPPNGKHSDETQIVPTKVWLRRQQDKFDCGRRLTTAAQAQAEMKLRWEEFDRAMQMAKEAQSLAIQSEIDFVRATAAESVPLKAILLAVVAHYKLAISDVISARRDNAAVTARHMAMYIARHHTPRSLPQIGKVIGGRDHTTVLHGVRKMEERLKSEPVLTTDLAAIRARLGVASCVSASTERGRPPIES